MADGPPRLYTVGNVLKCITLTKRIIEGQVMAYDSITNFLILKCANKKGIKNYDDFEFVNLSYVIDVKITDDYSVNCVTDLVRFPDIAKCHNKFLHKIDEKCIERNFPDEGKKLLKEISKVYAYQTGQVQLKNNDIIIMDDIAICPPYQIESIKCLKPNQKLYNFVKKLIEKTAKDTSCKEN